MPTTDAPTSVAISPRAISKRLKYVPNNAQMPLHAAMQRHRVAAWGRRAGKSTGGGHELTWMGTAAYHEQGRLRDLGQQRRVWIVGPNYDDAEREFRVLYNNCKRLEIPFDKPGTYYSPGQPGGHTISLWGGLFIVECRSADHPDSLDGEGLDFVLMAEAAKMKRLIWTKFIRAALADKRGGSLWNSTPEGKNFFYEHWQAGQDPSRTDWWSARFPSWVNQFVFPGGRNDPEIIEMRKEMSAEKFNQEIGAEFSDYVGRVFKDWDEETHVRDLEFNPKWPLYGAVDYGFTNPNVWLALQIDEWDNVYVLGEFYKSGLDATEFADELSRWPLAANAHKFFPDPASPGDTKILERKLRIKAQGNTGGELKHRLEYIRRWLKPGPETAPEEKREPKMFVDRSCTNFIREFDAYRYPDDPGEESNRATKEDPLKKDDHTPEALGRFFRGYYGPPGGDRKRGARVRSANVRRAA